MDKIEEKATITVDLDAKAKEIPEKAAADGTLPCDVDDDFDSF